METDQLLKLLIREAPALQRQIEHAIPTRFRALLAPEDVLQEVWIAAFRQGADNVRDLHAWLNTVTRATLLRALRDAQALKRGGDRRQIQAALQRSNSLLNLFQQVREDGRTPSGEVSSQEACHAVQVALAALPEERRHAVYLCHIQGLSRRQVAAQLGKSEAAINSLVFQGLRQLRELVGTAADYFSDVRSSELEPPDGEARDVGT